MSDNGHRQDPLRNPRDPIRQSGPESGLELFRTFSRVATGFPREAVVDAAVNVLVNNIRQGCASWREAERIFDETFGKTKQLLKDHYDSGGRRKGIFPFHQVILPSFHKEDDKTR